MARLLLLSLLARRAYGVEENVVSPSLRGFDRKLAGESCSANSLAIYGALPHSARACGEPQWAGGCAVLARTHGESCSDWCFGQGLGCFAAANDAGPPHAICAVDQNSRTSITGAPMTREFCGARSQDQICACRQCQQGGPSSGWRSSTGNACQEYHAKKWCTPSGGRGIGWDPRWGDFDRWQQNGVSADEACCQCGGGVLTPPPGAVPSAVPTPAPTPALTQDPLEIHGFELTAGTFCENWDDLLLTTEDHYHYTPTMASAWECAKLCANNSRCLQFNFQPAYCYSATAVQRGAGTCFLYKERVQPAKCIHVPSSCWDLYTWQNPFASRHLEVVCPLIGALMLNGDLVPDENELIFRNQTRDAFLRVGISPTTADATISSNFLSDSCPNCTQFVNPFRMNVIVPGVTRNPPAPPSCPRGFTGLLPYISCTQFYQCVGGNVVWGSPLRCPSGTLFNARFQVCAHASSVFCNASAEPRPQEHFRSTGVRDNQLNASAFDLAASTCLSTGPLVWNLERNMCFAETFDCDGPTCEDSPFGPRFPSNDLAEDRRPDTCPLGTSGRELCDSGLFGAINFIFQEMGTPTGEKAMISNNEYRALWVEGKYTEGFLARSPRHCVQVGEATDSHFGCAACLAEVDAVDEDSKQRYCRCMISRELSTSARARIPEWAYWCMPNGIEVVVAATGREFDTTGVNVSNGTPPPRA